MARKEKKYHFIYKTTNVVTNRYYFGMHSTDNLDDGYLGSGRRLKYSINKYGKENHQREVIEYCPDRSSLKKREAEIVNLNEVTKKDCMNLMIGGDGGFISDEQQKHRSSCGGKATALKLKNDPEFMKKHQEIASEKMKLQHKLGKITPPDWTDRKHSEETKRKMSLKASERTGYKNSQYGTCWITNGKESKKIFKGDDIPDGWRLGRKIKLISGV